MIPSPLRRDAPCWRRKVGRLGSTLPERTLRCPHASFLIDVVNPSVSAKKPSCADGPALLWAGDQADEPAFEDGSSPPMKAPMTKVALPQTRSVVRATGKTKPFQ